MKFGQQRQLVESLIQQGQALEDSGSVKEALKLYQEAVDLSPTSVSAWLNRGNALQLLGKVPEAVDSFRQAQSLDRRHAGAWLNLGNALLLMPGYTAEQRTADLYEAEAAYSEAIALRPDWAEAYFGLGCALEVFGRHDESCAAYSAAEALDPEHRAARFNRIDQQAEQLLKSNQLTAAREMLEEGLKSEPGNHRLLARMTDLERAAGNLDKSLAILQQMNAEAPKDFPTRSSELFTMNLKPEVTARALFEAHRQFGLDLEQFIKPLRYSVTGRSDRSLRIGYVSPDFRQHAVAVFILPVLERHDRSRFEIYGYYCEQHIDNVTKMIRDQCDHWRHVAKFRFEDVAQQIIDDEIDILVDLAGHTAYNRLEVFAYKPAPVQITWLGYLGTTGMSRMDYRLCDANTDPPGVAEAWHTEKLLRMPHTQWCYQPQLSIPAPGPLPFLSRGYWTFGSFNNALKLNADVFSAWAHVLREVKHSRLRIFSIENDEIAQWVRTSLAKCGLTMERVELVRRVPTEEYYASAGGVDIALDSFPYSGGTTTCDSLMMGLPVATVDGKRTIARSGVGLLRAVNLDDWIAPSAIELATILQRQIADPQRLAELRAALPSRLKASPIMDAERFTRDLEHQFQSAFDRWQGSL